MKKVLPLLLLLLALGSFGFSEKPAPKNSGVFSYDEKAQKILSLNKTAPEMVRLHLVSVTVDQPTYWPNEDVYLKALFPNYPNQTVEIWLMKKDANKQLVGKYRLDANGVLVAKIMQGSKTRLELGEYQVTAKLTSKKFEDLTTFSVIEGALGAVSFAHEFKNLTDAKELPKVSGGWFLGNAQGVGVRWGNGLNVKNQIRILNQPYSGKVQILSRCFLPGCDGIEAGPMVTQEVKNGWLETVLDVSSHSGPFEIEVITPKGSVRHLFAKSGHVERRTFALSQGLTNKFLGTVAPYAGTKAITGRDIYYLLEGTQADDPLELFEPVAAGGLTKIKVKKNLFNARIAVFTPKAGDDYFAVTEIPVAQNLPAGRELKISVKSPYSLIVIAGFLGGTKKFYQGWGIVFTPSTLACEVKTPKSSGGPLQEYEVGVRVYDRATNQGLATTGILTIYDNRVLSEKESEKLVSAIGDSTRSLSDYFSSWHDFTGVAKEETVATPNLGFGSKSQLPATSYKKTAADDYSPPPLPSSYQSDQQVSGKISATEQPEIRLDDKKVIYCGLVQTNTQGLVLTKFKLPPQTGRCQARFVAVKGFEYAHDIADFDVVKRSFVETSLNPLLLPGAEITATALVVNGSGDQLILKLAGAGLPEPIVRTITKGQEEISFRLLGGESGELHLTLSEKNGRVVDEKMVKLRNPVKFMTTFSELIVSNGEGVRIRKGERVGVYMNAGQLLSGMVNNVVTTMYSWFGHAEALSAAAAARAMLLSSIEHQVISDEGMRDRLKSDLNKTVRDLEQAFYDQDAKLFRPYPGLAPSQLWSAWAAKNLELTAQYLSQSPKLKVEFSETISKATAMSTSVNAKLKQLGQGALLQQADQNALPITVNGKVVYRLVTDDAVAQWYLDNVKNSLDIKLTDKQRDLNLKFIKLYDTYRFLRAFEKTGEIYYLLGNAKALYLKGSPDFFPLFNVVAKGMIATQDPGMIKGPALLGGVYSAPQTLVKFLDLLVTMGQGGKTNLGRVETRSNLQRRVTSIKEQPLIFQSADDLVLTASKYSIIRIDRPVMLNLNDYIKDKPFFKVSYDRKNLKINSETTMFITLDKELDPTEYYALVAVPSNLSIRQTADILSDYKGELIYGQRSTGSDKIQYITLPFRGLRQIALEVAADYQGKSPGFVLVRHISNPNDIAAVKTEVVEVK